MRPAWVRGANYDRAKLTFWTATPGFIIGRSELGGPDLLGAGGADVQIPADFTSMQISSQTTVEAGTFVHREVETCQLTATLPSMVDLSDQIIAVKYAGTEVYRGQVTGVQWEESVEIAAEYKRGNTAIKTYRVALVATTGEDALPGMATPPRNFTTETLAQRIASWTSLTVTTQSPAVDIPVNWQNAGWDTASIKKVYRDTDQLGSLLDTLRAECRLRNMTFIYQPLAAQPFVLKPNNQWLVGTKDTPLTFSDNPAHVYPQAVDPADVFTHLGRFIGYSSRSIGSDASMFPNSVLVQWGQYDVESPPADGQPVATSRGPYRASGANNRDTVLDLGTLDLAPAGTLPYWFSRAVAAIIPLKANAVPFTKTIVTPLQSVQQLQGTVPGMAVLEHDGTSERVAVLAREHVVTPGKWMVRYTLGPPHLLDRKSDFDPATPEVKAPVAGPGGGQTTLEWIVPTYPADASIYEVVYAAAAGTALVTSDQAFLLGVNETDALPPGTVRQLFVSGPVTTWWVLYTSNTGVGTVNPSAAWREGPPGFLGTTF